MYATPGQGFSRPPTFRLWPGRSAVELPGSRYRLRAARSAATGRARAVVFRYRAWRRAMPPGRRPDRQLAAGAADHRRPCDERGWGADLLGAGWAGVARPRHG